MNSHGENGDNTTHSRRKYSKGSCLFHPDAVTAKTISRLSQRVARLTANDSGERDSKSIVVMLIIQTSGCSRSEPTASSSPIVTSSPDESHAYCFHSMRRRRWRRRHKEWWHKKRESHSAGGTDCRWNSWRNPEPPLGELSDGRSSVHRIYRRCDIFDLNEESSEEGPLKKARVAEKVFENIHRRRCRCDGLLRRTASLSPRRSYQRSWLVQHENMVVDSKKHRKPMKFRKSLLTTRTIKKSFTKYNDDLNENRPSKPSCYKLLNDRSDEDEEGRFHHAFCIVIDEKSFD
ncbi:unnamed protein product [Taenia asiatica]|uniref:Uncharacterized protein n=1 Tax=Taenia asiatica TaxID=60517 RepID=A0A0R3VSI3_TAEAS|nr:unnamed protein product [Taenia asiatica]